VTSLEQLEAFYRNRDEVFLGEITYEHVETVITQLLEHKLQEKPLKLVICSPGGVTNAGFDLAQFIEQELESDVTARVWGRCSSAATYTLLCCRSRVAHPQARFVIHRQTTSLEIEYTDTFKEKIAEWERDNAFTHQQQIDFYSRKLNCEPDKVVKLLDRGMGLDCYISATEALELRLITDISTFS
jgi:ATP-dependent protease ClpP protease subunit